MFWEPWGLFIPVVTVILVRPVTSRRERIRIRLAIRHVIVAVLLAQILRAIVPVKGLRLDLLRRIVVLPNRGAAPAAGRVLAGELRVRVFVVRTE